ncbi:cytochrome ubiquinol oxidase subunit I [Alkalimonas collagenimarina]|uniref:Cytochrome ubiquinol oxidase subunit I n=1 Tax=Alkalimonas collagenimarina TaxID=400390 RepID=A0ABT9H3G1_9GAMM|nr:cytochrome ubiquinol oxidase subunit I [Alkalimonas collagenimarina]MDP4537827.1 cytochrome ubiquinol oxidase subunit I [Alkalimonas collagenimarina]
MLDTLILSRIQFAANISFHILFPTITIALGWLLFYFKIRYDFSKHPVWMRAYRFWVKVFALTFALGVVSGITMSFQFGTNWPGFMEAVGNIAGPLLAYEILTAFFLEATLLGIMLFGFHRVPGWAHTGATFLVALATTLSAFWILALNSWMQTPAGFEMRDGVAHATDWLAIIFSPSFPYRLGHMLLASALTVCFLVAGLSAYRLLRGDNKKAPQLTLKTALFSAALLVPVQAFVGDLHGLNTLEHQPQKIAAMEGLWQTQQGAPFVLFAIPDEANRQNRFALEIPNLASLILTHQLDGELQGLDDFVGEHPPVAPVFFSFRIMVGVGLLMLAVAWWCSVRLYRHGTLSQLQLKLLVGMTFSGWVATLAGWYVTEIGRQPYLVYGVLKTRDAVTTIASEQVAISLTLYLLLYAVLLFAYIKTLFVLARRAIEVEEYDLSQPGLPERKASSEPHTEGATA